MRKFFRTDDGRVLKFVGGCWWTDGTKKYSDSPAVGQQPIDENGPIPGHLLKITTGDQLLNKIIDTLAEVGGDTLAAVANVVLSDRFSYLTTEGADDLFEVVTFSDGNLVATYHFNPPLVFVADSQWSEIGEVRVYELEGGGMYDIFDQDGNCLNEGNWWTFLPTEAEVKEFVATNKIKGKIE